ncbi:response regulator transcription factor [Microbacterium saperdae]|uniref:LuxR family two component transcriptional regulator n=1 Tax=Microbacterium saperdae TaxID=69368 RepID=A0A543BMR4_9MICO|nr:response regulator transcription factor [Microbacterium saperdae]TQL86058.1 LuxR family two component transcriptional regulator [Microbacterium saperdae]GGM50920.1 DNA-binding response regulator [Microbacterium saperdae]
MSISILVVDDQPLVRQAVRDILTDGGIRVVGEASNGREAVALVTEERPDVVLMDIRMPEMDGIAATASICAEHRGGQVRVLILTTFEEDEYVVAALRAGASGFIGKGAEPEEIVHAVRTIHAGESLLSSAATRALIQRSVQGAAPTTSRRQNELLTRLTAREREVLLLVAAGRTNQEIAAELTISPHTAKTHVNRIMSKVEARDRAQLVILAYESGLVVAGA